MPISNAFAQKVQSYVKAQHPNQDLSKLDPDVAAKAAKALNVSPEEIVQACQVKLEKSLDIAEQIRKSAADLTGAGQVKPFVGQAKDGTPGGMAQLLFKQQAQGQTEGPCLSPPLPPDRPCLSIQPPPDRPCLSIQPPEGPCLSIQPPPDQPCLSVRPPEGPCLSIQPPPDQPCLSIQPPDDPPERPCLSIQPPPPGVCLSIMPPEMVDALEHARTVGKQLTAALAHSEADIVAKLDEGYTLSGVAKPADRQTDDGNVRFVLDFEPYNSPNLQPSQMEVAIPADALPGSLPSDAEIRRFENQMKETLRDVLWQLADKRADGWDVVSFSSAPSRQDPMPVLSRKSFVGLEKVVDGRIQKDEIVHEEVMRPPVGPCLSIMPPRTGDDE